MTAPFQVMPPLTPEELEALRADIAERGVLVPVLVDQHGRVLDGHHRRQLAEELGIDCPTEIRMVADDEEAREIALAANLIRRHLSAEQRAALVAQLRGQGWSLRRIADVTGVSKSTVDRDLATVPDGTVPDRVIGKDGKSRPAARPLHPEYFSSVQEEKDVFLMADASEEEFEAALTACRADGDLSRENIVRKLGALDQPPPAEQPATSYALWLIKFRAVQREVRKLLQVSQEAHAVLLVGVAKASVEEMFGHLRNDLAAVESVVMSGSFEAGVERLLDEEQE